MERIRTGLARPPRPAVALVLSTLLAPLAGAQTVASFTLIDAASDQPIAAFDPLTDGAVIGLDTLQGVPLNVRADTAPPTVGSVAFTLTGPTNQSQTENAAPYALFGDSSGDYNPWTPVAGAYTLTATPYTGANAGGAAGTPLSIAFSIASDGGTGNQPPTVDAGPSLAVPAGTPEITLTATASDPDGQITDYLWEQTGGPTATLAGADTDTLTASALTEAVYAFRVTVTDDDDATASDSVTVTVGEPPSSAVITGELKQWHRVTLTFPGPFATELGSPNPFLDYRMEVTFSDGATEMTVPGAFAADGDALNTGATEGDRWRCHFAPPTPGEWTYTVRFREGPQVAVSDDAGTPLAFDGDAGSFTIEPTDKAAPDFRAEGRLAYVGEHHLRHLGSGRYFIKGGADSPENWLGYTGFDNTVDGGAGPSTPDGLHAFPTHEADWNQGDPDWDRNDPPGTNNGRAIVGALNYLHERGINAIYFLPMNIGGDGKDSWPYPGPIAPSGSTNNDNTRIDVSKCDQWEVVFAHAQELGILLHVVLAEAEAPNKNELDNATLGVERRLYYRELAARFAHHNAIVWNVSEEYNLNLNIGVAEALNWAGGISDADPYGHPVTVHNAGGLSNPTGGPWGGFIGQPDIDATSLQWARRTTGWSDIVESFRDATANAGRPIPVMIDEPGSPTRDFNNNFDAFRRQVIWPILLSGGNGEWFINNRDQSLEDFREFEQIWDDTARCRLFIERFLPFWRMQPDDALVDAPSGVEDPDALAAPGEIFGVYLPAGGPATLDLGPDVHTYEILWLNPRAGSPDQAPQTGSIETAQGPGVQSIGAPPSDPTQDWFAVVRRTDTCPADLNADGVLDLADITLFVDLFNAGDPGADLNGDTILDLADVTLFVDSFLAGCP